jgi:hypothetical protein
MLKLLNVVFGDLFGLRAKKITFLIYHISIVKFYSKKIVLIKGDSWYVVGKM